MVDFVSGADDNASGMAVLLQVADVFAYGSIRTEHTAIFVAFDFKEFVSRRTVLTKLF